MSLVPQRRTSRLVLRGFEPSDLAPFAAMNADPRVMAFYVATLSEAQSDEFVARVASTWREWDFGLWALERREDGAFLGYAGLWPVPLPVPVEPRVEVGWRLAAEHWGRGYATEAAHAALAYAFADLGRDEVVSFTSVSNTRSRAVMNRLGMTRDPDGDFDHPALPPGHPLRAHLLYRKRSESISPRQE